MKGEGANERSERAFEGFGGAVRGGCGICPCERREV